MCGGCSARWVDPATGQPAILPGGEPFWPPGNGLPSCGSCDDQQCQLGCMMAFDPSLAPLPPNPPPPPALPLPPAPWPNAGSNFNFSGAFGDNVVLQQAPAIASVYGNTGALDDGAEVLITVAPSAGGGAPYSVPAAVQGGRWRALLRPTAPFNASGVTYSITASCATGCAGGAPVTLNQVVFGQVYFCAGRAWRRCCCAPVKLSARASPPLRASTRAPAHRPAPRRAQNPTCGCSCATPTRTMPAARRCSPAATTIFV